MVSSRETLVNKESTSKDVINKPASCSQIILAVPFHHGLSFVTSFNYQSCCFAFVTNKKRVDFTEVKI